LIPPTDVQLSYLSLRPTLECQNPPALEAQLDQFCCIPVCARLPESQKFLAQHLDFAVRSQCLKSKTDRRVSTKLRISPENPACGILGICRRRFSEFPPAGSRRVHENVLPGRNSPGYSPGFLTCKRPFLRILASKNLRFPSTTE
jgi:hypothetical protein